MSDSIPNWISHTVTGIQGAEYHLVLLKHKIFDLQGYWISKLKCLADCLKQRRWKAKSKKHWKASLIQSNSGVRVRLLLHSFFSLPVLSDPILHLPYRYEYDSSNIGYAFLGTLQCSKIKKKITKWEVMSRDYYMNSSQGQNVLRQTESEVSAVNTSCQTLTPDIEQKQWVSVSSAKLPILTKILPKIIVKY